MTTMAPELSSQRVRTAPTAPIAVFGRCRLRRRPEPPDGLTPVSIGLIGVLGAVFACALGYACFRALFSRDGVPTGSLERKPSGRGMGLSAPEGDGMILGVTAAGARTVASI